MKLLEGVYRIIRNNLYHHTNVFLLKCNRVQYIVKNGTESEKKQLGVPTICVQISYTKQKPVTVILSRTCMLVTPRTLGPWDPDPPLQLPLRSPTASPASDSFFGYSTATSGKLNLAPQVVGSRMDSCPTDLEAAVDQGPSCPEHPSRHPLRVHQTYHQVLAQACSCRSCCSCHSLTGH